ncbi:MAG TPA: alpha-amylase family glycosyl hydrolase [Steroidobacteraceae bacterium]|nr:alpha-amylase family glycosyl hydrolase [Steroidobacteraceae bacterium]
MRLKLDRARANFYAAFAFLALFALTGSPLSRAADADARATTRQSPEWLRDAVVYEVFPRAFSPDGNLKGVTAQLDRLKDLGVSVLWLMPIHPMGKLKAKGSLGSPYAVRDYDAIDPAYGTPDDFKKLIAAAHQRKMKVFIDIVANHTAWDSVLIGKHPDWYTHDGKGQIVPPNPDWVDVADLDYSSPALRQYMSDMLVRWLRDYGVDGFRCDYASGVPTDFWETVRPELDRVRPGLAFLAEADDPALLHKAFDIDYAWDFYHVVAEALAGKTPASQIRATWERAEAKYPRGALRLRFSDNHDQLRTTGQAGLPAALAASALMFTLDGVPLLYNGMEVGDTTESAAPALFERTPIQWEMAERRPQVAPYYRALAALRRAHPALTRGAVHWLRNGDEQRVVSFERTSAGETLVVVINLSSQEFSGIVATGSGKYQDITPDLMNGAVPGTQRAVALPAVFLAPWEFRVFSRAAP